jgi:hypothetical protein
MGQNVTQLSWPKMQWTECAPVTFEHQKSVQTPKSAWVEKQSVHLEIKCHSGCSEPYDIALGGCCVGWTFC